MDATTEMEVRRRAGQECEYCRLPQKFSKLALTIDHVIARKHGGGDDMENLALACASCNRHKRCNIAGRDPITGNLTRLFDPRRDRWLQHFRREGEIIVGMTPEGRTTLAVLSMNHVLQLALRRALINAGDILPDDV